MTLISASPEKTRPAAGQKAYVRPVAQDDMAKINDLVEVVGGKTEAALRQAEWNWYFDGPPVRRPVSVSPPIVVDKKGQLVGLWGFVPCRIHVADLSYDSGWTMAFMSHPKHRGEGLKLVRHIKSGGFVGIGFPTEETIPLHRKIFGSDTIECPRSINFLRLVDAGAVLKEKQPKRGFLAPLVRPLHKLAMAGHDLVRPLWSVRPKGLQIAQTDEFGPEFDLLFERAKTQHGVLPDRSAAFLDWRFRASPARSYTVLSARMGGDLVGYIAFRTVEKDGRRIGRIVDCLCLPEGPWAGDALIAAAVDTLKRGDIQLIQATFSATSKPYIAALRRHGFFFKTRGKLLMLRLPKDQVSEELENAFVANAGAWHFTQADADLDFDA